MAGRRHNLFWAAVALVVAIGGLVIANTLQFDPQDIRDELEQEIAEVKQERDVLRQDALIHSLQQEQKYKEYAKGGIRELERIHPRICDAAKLEKEALGVVPPFLVRCRDLSNVPAAELARLYDETRSHLANYGTTRHGPALRDAESRLKALLEKQDRVGPQDLLILQKDVRDALQAGRIEDAKELIAKFRRRPGSSEYESQLRELEAAVKRRSAPPTPR